MRVQHWLDCSELQGPYLVSIAQKLLGDLDELLDFLRHLEGGLVVSGEQVNVLATE